MADFWRDFAVAQVLSMAEYRARRPLRSVVREDETYLTKAELAARWRVSERTLERWMKAGLPYRKPFERGAVSFPLHACELWSERRTG